MTSTPKIWTSSSPSFVHEALPVPTSTHPLPHQQYLAHKALSTHQTLCRCLNWQHSRLSLQDLSFFSIQLATSNGARHPTRLVWDFLICDCHSITAQPGLLPLCAHKRHLSITICFNQSISLWASPDPASASSLHWHQDAQGGLHAAACLF